MLHRGKKSEGGKCYSPANFEPSCPGIILHYGMKKLNIELNLFYGLLKFVRIVGGYSGEYEGYAIFF